MSGLRNTSLCPFWGSSKFLVWFLYFCEDRRDPTYSGQCSNSTTWRMRTVHTIASSSGTDTVGRAISQAEEKNLKGKPRIPPSRRLRQESVRSPLELWSQTFIHGFQRKTLFNSYFHSLFSIIWVKEASSVVSLKPIPRPKCMLQWGNFNIKSFLQRINVAVRSYDLSTTYVDAMARSLLLHAAYIV